MKKLINELITSEHVDNVLDMAMLTLFTIYWVIIVLIKIQEVQP